jgi:hypothetical protein
MSDDTRESSPPPGPPDETGPASGAGGNGSHATRDERALWLRVGPAMAGGTGDCPTDLELAAHLDGHDRAGGRPRVESHVASCAACLAAVDEIRGLLADETVVLVPDAVIAAARGLVPEEASLTSGMPPESSHEFEPRGSGRGGVRRWAQWGTAVAASVVVAIGGFHAGSRVTEADQSLADVLASELLFGLEGETGGSDLEFALLSLAATGPTTEDADEVTP